MILFIFGNTTLVKLWYIKIVYQRFSESCSNEQ